MWKFRNLTIEINNTNKKLDKITSILSDLIESKNKICEN
jgi:hypothetical protein